MKPRFVIGVCLVVLPILVTIAVLLWQDWHRALIAVTCTAAIIGSVAVGLWLMYREAVEE